MGYYYYGARSTTPNSIFNGLTLSPLPYPVLLILAVICIFLGISWYSSYEDAVETAEDNINWLLLAIPISIVFLVKWLSSMEDSTRCFGMSFFDRRMQPNYCAPPPQGCGGGGASPWGVAALIILLLVLIQCQSSWFI